MAQENQRFKFKVKFSGWNSAARQIMNVAKVSRSEERNINVGFFSHFVPGKSRNEADWSGVVAGILAGKDYVITYNIYKGK